jgi:hypothetical protein
MRFKQRMRVYSHPVRLVTDSAVLTMEGRASARLQEPNQRSVSRNANKSSRAPES